MHEPALPRLATSADLPALHALIESGYRGDSARGGWTHEADLLQDARTDAATLSGLIDDPAQRLLVLETEGRLVGCVNVADRGDGVAYMGLLCVSPALQAGGLGKRLIQAAEALAAAAFGARRMEMTVIDRRPELVAYYERRGYRLTGERRPFPVPAAFDFVVLDKALN